MKLKITKRDLGSFFLGVFVMIILDLIFNWSENVADFKRGVNDGRKSGRIESVE